MLSSKKPGPDAEDGPSKDLRLKPLPGASASLASILVVDDDWVSANSLTEILKRQGYAALAAYDSAGALEAALLSPPAVLIVSLPKTSGIELATLLQRLYPECKVILSSGLDSGEVRARMEGQNFTVLKKPIDPEVMLHLVIKNLGPTL